MLRWRFRREGLFQTRHDVGLGMSTVKRAAEMQRVVPKPRPAVPARVETRSTEQVGEETQAQAQAQAQAVAQAGVRRRERRTCSKA
jgi:hypothetical protein